jgi:hypothetical protein
MGQEIDRNKENEPTYTEKNFPGTKTSAFMPNDGQKFLNLHEALIQAGMKMPTVEMDPDGSYVFGRRTRT